ncbi:hypothetical protein Acr_28g0008160 [Actinidia rufa]|uniref:Glycine-rich protein n=1 Tax=Actinidia rufa TaxID=165716 RepID=A0A7J0HAX6_9ERIC|nr:hypothetical protein Acr_28g0008160 [Actinidia rufa]
MERDIKSLLVLAIFLLAFFASAEGGRELSTKEVFVYGPQDGGNGGGDDGGDGGGDDGSGWGPWFHFPWFGFPHFPWWWGGIDKAEDVFKDIAKVEHGVREVPKLDGKVGHGYP